MPTPIEAYREGYEKGRSDTAGGRLAETTMGMLRDDPGRHFQNGYSDGAAGRPFNPPSIPAPSRLQTNGLIPKFSENPFGWFLAVIFVVELWVLWQLIKAPFQLIGALMRSEKPSPWIITKVVILVALPLGILYLAHTNDGATSAASKPTAPLSPAQQMPSYNVTFQETVGTLQEVPDWMGNLGVQVPPDNHPPQVYEDLGACPFECCRYGTWAVSKPAALIADWHDRSSKTVADLAVGDQVTGVSGVVITSRPGVIRVNAPFSMGGVHMNPGDLVYVLTNKGEGFVKGFFRGRTVENIDSGWKELSPVTTSTAEWWAQVRTVAGAVGWTDKMDSFRGVDGCAGESVAPLPSNADVPPVSPNQVRPTPSFDCARARTATEVLICGDVHLSNLDVEMVESMNNLLGRLPESDKTRVKREHLEWFKDYSKTCNALSGATSSSSLYQCIESYLTNHTNTLRARLSN